MRAIRTVVGIVISCLLIASSAMHSLMGWAVQRKALGAVNASADLVSGLAMGWHFAGLAMLVFGAIALATFVLRSRGRPAALWPVWLIAAGYVLFGATTYASSGGDAFFLFLFLLPGILLGLAAWPDRGPGLASPPRLDEPIRPGER